MRDLAVLFVHLIATVARLLGRGGARSVVAESLLLKHQLLILNRSRVRAPNLRPIDRVIAGLCTGLMRPSRLLRSAIVLKPSTIMAFHRALVKRKYRLLFTPRQHRKPGPKGPARELITAIVEMKHRNPRFGCRRIAQQLAFMFGVELDRDVVRRVLARRYRPEPGSQGPSWLTFLAQACSMVPPSAACSTMQSLGSSLGRATCVWRISDLSHRSCGYPSLVTFVLIATMARCATWSSCLFISSPRSSNFSDRAALVPLPPSRFCSNISS